MSSLIGSFDPALKREEFKKYQNRYGNSNVIVIQRSKLFLLLKIIHPLFWYAVAYSLIIRWATSSIKNAETIWYIAIIWFLLVVILFSIMHTKRLLDYLMDFIIVTPDHIISYNQTGIRKRKNLSIESSKIKSIKTNYRNRIFSIANNGDIAFLSEWDAWGRGEIQAFYVHQPQKKKERIHAIISQNDKHIHTDKHTHTLDQ